MLAGRRTPACAALAVVLALALAACTGGDPVPAPDGSPTPTVDPGPSPEDVVATVVIPESGVEVEVGVHPVVRAGEYAVLTLDLTALTESPTGDRVHVYGFDGALGQNLPLRRPSNVRLVDLERDLIYHPGVGADDWPVVAPSDWHHVSDPGGSRVLIPYPAPAPDVTSLSVFLPGAPLLADVPVIDGEVPSSVRPEQQAQEPAADPSASGTATPSPAPEPQSLAFDEIVEARTFPLDSTSAELAGAVTTTESVERVDVQLGADVLFDFDQATLTPAASEALGLVAARVSEREAGTVSIVGHTDDQGDDAYNRDLSLRRAQAVADALSGLVDPSSYPMTAEGRGEAEPFVANDSEENRARNRRVAVTLTSTVVTRTDITTTGELPPFGEKGQVADAGSVVSIAGNMRSWEVAATARRVHGHVVVDLTVHGADDAVGAGWVLGALRGFNTHRGKGSWTPLDVAGNAVVLQGASRLFPMDYTTGPLPNYPAGEWLSVSDLNGASRIDGGQTRTYSYVFPRMDVGTVTFQVGNGLGADEFRFVDLAVAPDDAD
ncbi:OmpA family protein [Cellulomonas xiejunii]|uniref:OmpA family protein n=1 Tax=Cellulomonas xiejunii TaxID=2968083 RepID=UPI001D0DC473|nr:OmpA family protein [Cellulomonas xiejunii]MCC2315061.1 OmpA family protein [Cellulomonas xiejunii]